MDREEMKRKVVVEDDEQVDEEEEEQVLMKEEEEEEEDEVNADTMLLGSGKGGEDAESDNGEEELDDMLEDDVVHLNVSAGTYEHALYGYDCFILRSKTDPTAAVACHMEKTYVVEAHSVMVSAIGSGGRYVVTGSVDEQLRLAFWFGVLSASLCAGAGGLELQIANVCAHAHTRTHTHTHTHTYTYIHTLTLVGLHFFRMFACGRQPGCTM